MNSPKFRSFATALLAFALFATACGASDDSSVATTDAANNGDTTVQPAATAGTVDEGPTAEPEPEPEPEADAPAPKPQLASAADQEVVDAIVTAIEADDEFPAAVDSECLAIAMVNGLGGADNMQERFGLNPETIAEGKDINDAELPKDEAIAMADGMFSCGLMDMLVGEMAGDGLSEADARCLIDNIDQTFMRDMVASGVMSEADALEVEADAQENVMSSLFSAMAACELDPSTLGG